MNAPVETVCSFNSEARLRLARRQCHQNGHPMPPPGPTWDSTTSGVCVNCGETWTREPIVRTEADIAELALQKDIVRQRAWGPGAQFIVTVTLEDIRKGKRGAPQACALALAAARELNPETQFCSMDSDGSLEVLTNRTDEPPRIDMFDSREAGEWVDRFDRSKSDVTPERFVFKRRIVA